MTALQVRSEPVSAAPVVEQRVALRKLLWVAPLLLVAALVTNSVIRAAALLFNTNSGVFMPVAGPTYIVLTIAGVLGAVLVFLAVVRFGKRPLTWYPRIALAALLLSLIPDIGLLFAPSPAAGGGFSPAGGGPGPAALMGSADLFSVGALMLMHAATALLCIVLLTRLTRHNPIGRVV